MRIHAIFSLCFIALVACTSAQRCIAPSKFVFIFSSVIGILKKIIIFPFYFILYFTGQPNCLGGRNVGLGGRGCIQRIMWYWNQRTMACEPMRYLGCRGSNNRWCTKVLCEQACRRRN